MMAENELQKIDDGVFEHAPVVTDNWDNGAGSRLYEVIPPTGENHSMVYAVTDYTREIDKGTGEPVEDETVVGLGEVSVDTRLDRIDGRLIDRLEDEEEGDYWDFPTVEMITHDFEAYLEGGFEQILLESSPDNISFGRMGELVVVTDEERERQKLGQFSSSFGEVDWYSFIWALSEESTVIDYPEGHHKDKMAYCVDVTFENVPEWRLRAAEKYHCGLFRSAPELANVAALREETDMTQVEMATELEKSESTISLQMDKVKDWERRAEWVCSDRCEKN